MERKSAVTEKKQQKGNLQGLQLAQDTSSESDVMTSRIQGILMWHIINTRAVSSCNSCGNNPKVRCSHISVQAKTRQIEVIALKQVS